NRRRAMASLGFRADIVPRRTPNTGLLTASIRIDLEVWNGTAYGTSLPFVLDAGAEVTTISAAQARVLGPSTAGGRDINLRGPAALRRRRGEAPRARSTGRGRRPVRHYPVGDEPVGGAQEGRRRGQAGAVVGDGRAPAGVRVKQRRGGPCVRLRRSRDHQDV